MLKRCKQTGHTRPQAVWGVTRPAGLWLCLVCFVLFGTGVVWAFPQEDTRLHKEAKLAIYHKEWQQALNLLGELENRFPESTLRTEALYWTAYTLEKLSHGPGPEKKLLSYKTEAIAFLNRLIKNYPDSPWRDDAQILRIDLATDLLLMGQKGFKKYIWDSIQSEKMEDMELKMVALDAMLRLDRPLALQLLIKEYLKINDPCIRENFIFILRRANEEFTIQRLLDPKKRIGNVETSESDCQVYATSRKLDPHLAAHKIVPEYPRDAIQECLGGTVVLKIVIDRRGRIFEAEVVGSPHPLFREAAIKAVKQWIYNPFTRNGTRESVSCVVTFKFFLSLK